MPRKSRNTESTAPATRRRRTETAAPEIATEEVSGEAFTEVTPPEPTMEATASATEEAAEVAEGDARDASDLSEAEADEIGYDVDADDAADASDASEDDAADEAGVPKVVPAAPSLELADGEEVIAERELEDDSGYVVTNFGRKLHITGRDEDGPTGEVLTGPGVSPIHDQPAENGTPGYRLDQAHPPVED